MNISLQETTKQQIIENFRLHENDTASPEVQVALLTREILILTEHLKVHKKDKHSKLGLYKKVSYRASLLNYLKNKNEERYFELIARLGLRK